MLSLVSASPVSEPPGSGVPASTCGSFTHCRTLFALLVVVTALATAGWTTVQPEKGQPTVRTAAWEAGRHGDWASRTQPGPEASPGSATSFFRTPGPTAEPHPADCCTLVVGWLDGAPVKLRYLANRSALPATREVERRRMTEPRRTGHRPAARRPHRRTFLSAPGRDILAFDPTAPGRGAEVFGDLERAERVSVVLPLFGIGAVLLTFEPACGAHNTPGGVAKALHRRACAALPGVRAAVVA